VGIMAACAVARRNWCMDVLVLEFRFLMTGKAEAGHFLYKSYAVSLARVIFCLNLYMACFASQRERPVLEFCRFCEFIVTSNTGMVLLFNSRCRHRQP